MDEQDKQDFNKGEGGWRQLAQPLAKPKGALKKTVGGALDNNGGQEMSPLLFNL